MTETIIIYKSYTPKMAEYFKTYYQQNKDKLLEQKKEYYKSKSEEYKTPEFKEKKKQYHKTYINNIKNDPERLEQQRQKQRDYYRNKILKKEENAVLLNMI